MADTVTLLDFPQVSDIQDGDLFYGVRGTGVDRDITLPGSVLKAYLGETLVNITETGSINLSNYKTNVLILCNPTADIALTVTGALPGGNKALIFNKSAYKVTLSIIGTAPEIYQGEYAEYFSDSVVMNLLGITRITEEPTAYSAATTYDADDVVDYFGVQYVSLQGSNTGNNPLFANTYWRRSPKLEELISSFQEGKPLFGGMNNIHNIRDGGYKQFFKIGEYKQGGKTLAAYGVHIDGTTVTGDTDLESIFRVGESDEYAYLDLFAPASSGTRTLKDYQGRVARAVTSDTGEPHGSGAVSKVQEDQMQLITGTLDARSRADAGVYAPHHATGSFSVGITLQNGTSTLTGAVVDTQRINFNSSGSPNARTSSTTDGESRMKNWAEGVPYIVVIKEVA